MWARGVRGTQHSVQVADAGSNPVGSTLPVLLGGHESGRKRRDISPSNLTTPSIQREHGHGQSAVYPEFQAAPYDWSRLLFSYPFRVVIRFPARFAGHVFP